MAEVFIKNLAVDVADNYQFTFGALGALEPAGTLALGLSPAALKLIDAGRQLLAHEFDKAHAYYAVAPDLSHNRLKLMLSAPGIMRQALLPKAVHSAADRYGQVQPFLIPAVVQLALNRLAAKLISAQQSRLGRPLTHEERRTIELETCILDCYSSSGDLPITQPNTWRCTSGDGYNVQIEWNPSLNAGEQSQLRARRGYFLLNHPDQWFAGESVECGVPFAYLWSH